jgi:Protein  of unknown function (DUF3018)
MGVHEPLTGAQRAARHRAAKKAQGLRLIQRWVPDVRNPEVRARLRREVEEINRRDRADGTMEYIASLYDDAMNALPPFEWDEKPRP